MHLPDVPVGAGLIAASLLSFLAFCVFMGVCVYIVKVTGGTAGLRDLGQAVYLYRRRGKVDAPPEVDDAEEPDEQPARGTVENRSKTSAP